MLRLLLLLLVPIALLTAEVARAQNERDLDSLVRRSAIVARGEIVGRAVDGADLHLLATYLKKGELAPVLRVRSEGPRALEPSLGERGLFFLAASEDSPGVLSFVQEDSERWTVEPENDAVVDAFMRRLVSSALNPAPGPMAEIWLQGLALPARSLSRHSARRLGALARSGALASEDWDRVLAFLQGGAGGDEAKAGVVTALADVLPADRLLALLPQAREGSRLKAAVLLAMGSRAAASGNNAQEQAKAALGAASADGSPTIALAAATGLAALGDESAIPALDQAISGADATARHEAVEALAKLAGRGSRAARARLHNLFEDSDGLVRARARQAWVDAYFADPERQLRTRPSLVFVGAALLLLLGVVVHSWIDKRRG